MGGGLVEGGGWGLLGAHVERFRERCAGLGGWGRRGFMRHCSDGRWLFETVVHSVWMSKVRLRTSAVEMLTCPPFAS